MSLRWVTTQEKGWCYCSDHDAVYTYEILSDLLPIVTQAAQNSFFSRFG